MGDLRKNRNKQQKEGNINIEFEQLLNRKNDQIMEEEEGGE